MDDFGNNANNENIEKTEKMESLENTESIKVEDVQVESVEVETLMPVSSVYEEDKTRTSNGDDESRQGADPFKATSFYTENYGKPKAKRGRGIMQLVLVAVIGSILGGAIVGSFLMFVIPSMQPSVRSYLGNLIPGSVSSNSSGNNDSSMYKKVEIVQQSSDSAVTAIAEKVGPSIVGIQVTVQQQAQGFEYFFGGQQQSGTAEGSGIILKSDGYILTNNHVVESAYDSRTGSLIKGSKIDVILPSQTDKPYSATVVGRDEKTDLAVLKIDANNLPAAEMGNSDDLKVGEMAVAIGNPGGIEYMGSVTVGVISGLNRTLPIVDQNEIKLIQTDAAINPGNSGGALLNSQGQVIGINTAKISAEGFEGLGFAIPITQAQSIIDSLMQYNYVKGRPWFGIGINSDFNEQVAARYKVPTGLLVSYVEPLSGAEKAGIKEGDIITKFDGQAVKTSTELDSVKNKHKPGDTVPVEIYRDGETKTLQVTLTENKG